jgi:hypothetical protein
MKSAKLVHKMFTLPNQRESTAARRENCFACRLSERSIPNPKHIMASYTGLPNSKARMAT